MERRSFVKSSLISGAATAMLPAASNAAVVANKSSVTAWYELRVYLLKDEAQQHLVEAYLKDAAIPALNRMGINQVGVFTEMKPTGQTRVFVLIPYKSPDQFNTIAGNMDNDAELQIKGAAYLNAPAKQPAYDRIESSLLKAFTHFPTLVAPEKKARIFELRQYQSATESAGKKKIDMFNNQGEIDIFKRLGFNPVFGAKR